MSDELPEGWAPLKLSDAGAWCSGGTPSRKVPAYFGGGVPWIKSGDLNDGLITQVAETISRSGLENSSAKLLPKGTVSIAMYGATIGRVGIFGIDAATNQACANCQVDERIVDRKLLLYYLLSQRDAFVAAGQGGAQPNISGTILKDWPFPLSPRPEQRRIVEKIEALLEQVNRAKGRLERVPLILKRFRQAVLAAACSGELTREWRESSRLHPPRPGSVGSVLRIKGGFAFPSDAFRPAGVPLVRQGNLGGDRVDLSKCVFLGPHWLESHGDFVLRRGDILIGMSGAVGKVCVYDRDEPALQNQRIGRLVIREDQAIGAFVPLLLEHLQPLLVQKGKGMGVLNVSAGDIESLECVIPVIQEQEKIVSDVQRVLQYAAAVEGRAKLARERSEWLPQAILSKAFSGELVPTEAELARAEGRTYTTAAELLAGLHSSETVSSGGKPGHRQRGRTRTVGA